FGAVAGEADGELALVVFTFDVNDGADAIGGMAHLAADHGIRGRALRTGQSGRARNAGRALASRGKAAATCTAKKRLRIMGGLEVGLIAALFAGLAERAAGGVEQFAGNFAEEARGSRGLSAFAAIHAA